MVAKLSAHMWHTTGTLFENVFLCLLCSSSCAWCAHIVTWGCAPCNDLKFDTNLFLYCPANLLAKVVLFRWSSALSLNRNYFRYGVTKQKARKKFFAYAITKLSKLQIEHSRKIPFLLKVKPLLSTDSGVSSNLGRYGKLVDSFNIIGPKITPQICNV